MDSTSDNNIRTVVALLTAMMSEQEELAYAIIHETDPVELFTALTGVLTSVLGRLQDFTGVSAEEYLQNLGMVAFRPE